MTCRTLTISLLATSLVVASCSSNDDSYEETLQLNSHQASCTTLIETTCLMRRASAIQPWTLFYGTIAGFSYRWGTLYEIRVRVTPVSNPPADGASLNYSLIEVVSARDVPRSETFQISVRNTAVAISTVDATTKRFALSGASFSCTPTQCAQLDQLSARNASATLTFDHSNSPAGPLNLLSVS
jgi:Domain of unknown function (DUF4377)